MLSLIWPRLRPWVERGEPFALATVTSIEGSGPRSPGACMAISADGQRFIGSASSGCLDAVIVDAAKTVISTGGTHRLRFGPDGQQPWSDGLTCGGWIEVRVDPWWGLSESTADIAVHVRRWLDEDKTGAIASSGDAHAAFDASGMFVAGDAGVGRQWEDRVREMLAGCVPSHEVPGGGAPTFLNIVYRRPRLVMIGGVDVAVHLVPLAHECGFSTIIVDPRAAFVASDRFTTAPGRIVRGWPETVLGSLELDARDAAVALTHDPKIDDQALLALLNTGVGYVGAMGSTRSHEARLARLKEYVKDASELNRIDGPAGIHLGIGSATGIALGVMAGIGRWSARRERKALAEALGALSASLAR